MPPVYDVALSFAGEDRAFASALALALAEAQYAVFYDEFETATLWGTDLSVSLGQIYRDDSRFCLIVVSAHYATKPWTNHERRFAIQRALTDKTDYILPIRLDDTELPGWPPTVAYLDARTMPVPEIVSTALAKLGEPVADRSASLATVDVRVVEDLISACFRRALFTRMDSEIDLGAMYASLAECLGLVQSLVPKLKTPELQHVGLRLIQTLDGIQRLTASQLRERGHKGSMLFSVAVPDGVRIEIDGLKLEALQLLQRLRRRTGANVMLPTALGYDHFVRVEQGREPPRITSDAPDALSVREHISHIEQEQRPGSELL
jgi:hypothetical protein